MREPRSTLESTSGATLVLAADPVKIPIDSNGNLTQKTEGSDIWTYEWNALNQLTRVTKNNVEQARFSYDSLHRRVEKVAGGVTIAYTYDGTNILRELRGSITLKYAQGLGIDEPLAVDDGAALSYFHADGLGSVAKVTSASGAVSLARRYDAWGNIEAGAGEPGYAFTGREWDPEIGAYYYRARYYDPKIGRFVGEDPLPILDRQAEEINAYDYVRSKPTNRVDPWGLESGAEHRWQWCLGNPACGRQPPSRRPPWDVWREAVNRPQPPGDRSNRRNHCIANCQLWGSSWPGVGPMISIANDYIFFTDETFPWFVREEDAGDMAANECGREGARQGKDCVVWCTDQMNTGKGPWAFP